MTFTKTVPLMFLCSKVREPWQDIHSKVQGKVVWDVMKNFVERWTKQVEGKNGSLYQITSDEFELEEEVGDWNVQLLRSITDDSASFSDVMRLYTLTVKKSRNIEDSIARGYVKAIRSAEHFLYIENQYFLGSAYAWAKDNQINCHHTIPAEIAEKVYDKILDGEAFCAYIVIPLHPDGDPASAAIQEILAWQRRTMSMMYKRIAQALKETNNPDHPQDYLFSLCPINKEDMDDIPEELETPLSGSKAAILRQSRRFMIYVHSKLMIVDDSLAIIGSANINQRSLAGSRDTEIAVSVHQPEHLAQGGNLSSGDVAQFRLRLMEEHLGGQSQVLVEPYSADCNDYVRGVCQSNWEVIFRKYLGTHKFYFIPELHF
jgi:phospholipase D1/2